MPTLPFLPFGASTDSLSRSDYLIEQMSVVFGFSAGDFIAAIELVVTVINGLRNSDNSSSGYRELVHQLYTLETGLPCYE